MKKFKTKTRKSIYGYTSSVHPGYIKIGETEHNVNNRIKQQCGTACIDYNIVFEEYAHGHSDKQFHKFLKDNGYKNLPDDHETNEWYEISLEELNKEWTAFLTGVPCESKPTNAEAIKIVLRENQRECADKIIAAYNNSQLKVLNKKDENLFLVNAKCRFGKTFTLLEVIKELGLKNVLIATQRPSIGNSWYEDYVKVFCSGDSQNEYNFVTKYKFVTEGKKNYITYEEFVEQCNSMFLGKDKQIRFVSHADLKGSEKAGGKFDKNDDIFNTEWDLVIIDEAHNSYDTEKGNEAYDNVKRKFTVKLSGTPYRDIAKNKYSEENYYEWTYEDEQKAKFEWDSSKGENPYRYLPQLVMTAYQPSEEILAVVDDIANQIKEEHNREEDFKESFTLNRFFELDENKTSFKWYPAVFKFLTSLRTKDIYPFATEEAREQFKHTVWRVSGIKAGRLIAEILRKDEVFRDYKIVEALGDEWKDDEKGKHLKEVKDAYSAVKTAIRENDKTITLTCGQLLEGVTVPEWTAILMLASGSSKSCYVQSIFRVQSPWVFEENGEEFYKDNAFVFDFDFCRALDVHSDWVEANNPNISYAEKEKAMLELINFFPVLGTDENGTLIEYDVTDVIHKPLKLRAVEAVKNRFQINTLFNLNHVFDVRVYDVAKKLTNAKNDKEDKVDKPAEIIEEGDLEEVQKHFGKEKYETLERILMAVNIPFEDFVRRANELATSNEWTRKMQSKFKDKMYSIAKADKIVDNATYEAAIEQAVDSANEAGIKELEKKEYKIDAVRESLKAFMDAFTILVGLLDPATLKMESIEETFKTKYPEDTDVLWQKVTNITFEEFIELRDTHNVFNCELFDAAFRELAETEINWTNVEFDK